MFVLTVVFMHLSFVSPWVDPRRTQGKWYFWYFFFPTRGWTFLVLQKASLDHRVVPTGFVRVLGSSIYIALDQDFSRLFTSSGCQTSILYCGCSYFPLGRGYLSLILCSLPRGFEWFLFVTKNNSPGVDPRGGK